MSAWTIGWLVWLGWFLVEEGLALRSSQPSGTLSEHVWAWFAITARGVKPPNGPPSPIVRARRVALLAFMAWLSVHFLTGGSFV